VLAAGIDIGEERSGGPRAENPASFYRNKTTSRWRDM